MIILEKKWGFIYNFKNLEKKDQIKSKACKRKGIIKTGEEIHETKKIFLKIMAKIQQN